MEELLCGLTHLLTTVFLSAFAVSLIRPVMTDVIVTAVCNGLNDTCSLAIYLTGLQQVVVGLGKMVMMPVIGDLADKYGTKTLLTVPMCLSIIPPAILGYKRDAHFFYAYYAIKMLFDIVCDGTIECLAYTYVAKNIQVGRRLSMFGVLAGVNSISGIFATLAARFLSISLTFQVSATSFFIGLVYMFAFLTERIHYDDGKNNYYGDDCECDIRILTEPILIDGPTKKHVLSIKNSSLQDFFSLIKNSTILVQALIVTFFSTISHSGMGCNFMYFLKARFDFNKNDFAELSLLVSVIGSISQLFILPMLISFTGENWLLSIGLFMEFLNATILSISWAAWVPFVVSALVPRVMFVMPAVSGLAAKQVGSSQQGKVHGCILAVKSFTEVVAPFLFTPLTAFFLSDDAPFYYPGASYALVYHCFLHPHLLKNTFLQFIGFFVSIHIKDVPASMNNESNNNHEDHP